MRKSKHYTYFGNVQALSGVTIQFAFYHNLRQHAFLGNLLGRIPSSNTHNGELEGVPNEVFRDGASGRVVA